MMRSHLRSFAPALALAIVAAACSSTATGPSVTFTAPLASSPASGTTYKYAQQPITLVLSNASTVSTTAVTYSLEVASDPGFATKVFTKDGIAEGTGGQTSVTLTTLDGPKTYYWRSRATVTGTAGEYSTARSFAVGAKVTVDKPQLTSPTSGATFYAVPTLVTKNAARIGPVTTMQYTFQVSTSSSFSSIAQQATVNEGSGGAAGTTSFTPTIALAEVTYYWRVRATDSGSGEFSPFSDSLAWNQRKGVDLAKVVYILGPNYTNWPVTNTITDAYHTGDQLCIDSEGENWPSTDFFGDPGVQVVGNQWNFLLIDGVWYGGAGHWFRPNQVCKGEVDDLYFIEGFLGREPMASFRPYEGMGFAVGLSTPARLWPSMATLDHRSNVVIIDW